MGSSCFGDRVQGEVNAFERSALSKSGCFYHLCRSFLTNPVQKHSSCLSHRSLERGVILFRRQSAREGNAFEQSALSKSGCFYHLCRSFLTNPVQKHALCLSLSLSLSQLQLSSALCCRPCYWRQLCMGMRLLSRCVLPPYRYI